MLKNNIIKVVPTQTSSTIRIRYNAAFLVGFATGFIWLVSLVGSPDFGRTTEVSSLRMLRLVMPLAIFTLIPFPEYIRLLHSFVSRISQGRLSSSSIKIGGLVLVFGIVPLTAGLATNNAQYLFFTVMPLLISLSVLLAAIALSDTRFEEWVRGICFAGVVLSCYGVATSGLGYTPYFGRPRALFGFAHPVSAASAITASGAYIALTYGPKIQSLPKLKRIPAILTISASFSTILFLTQSRNMLLSIIILFTAWLMFQYMSQLTRCLVFLFTFSIPISLYSFVLLGSEKIPLWSYIDQSSSYRLSFFKSVLRDTIFSPRGLSAIGSSTVQRGISESIGFAATDSIYLSFIINYGIIASLLFLSLMLMIGLSLSSSRRFRVAYSIFLSITVFFALDSQGITVSNLIVFAAFAFALRTAVLPVPPSEPHSRSVAVAPAQAG